MIIARLLRALACLAILMVLASDDCSASEFTVVNDANTGVKLSLPLDLLTVSSEASLGRDWATPDGGFNVSAIKFSPDQTLDLGFYEAIQNEGAQYKQGRALGRRVRSDWS